MRFRALSGPDRPALERLLAASPMGSVHGDPDWGRVLEYSGWQVEPFGVQAGDELLASALVATRRVPVIGWELFHLHGSLVGRDAEAIRTLVTSVVERAREARALRVRLAVKYPAADLAERIGSPLRDLLPSSPARSHRSEEHGTYWLDLREAESAWGPARWNPHNRRNLRKAERAGVVVRRAEGPEVLDRFESIYRATYKRKSLPAKPLGFFARLGPLLERGRIEIFFAWHRDQLLAATMMGVGNVCRYLWGGTVSAGPGVPPAGPILHLEMMRHAASRGAEHYDLGGAPGPEPVEGHPNHGVWRFKRGFNGRYVEYEEEYDLVLRPLPERLLEAAVTGLRGRPSPPIHSASTPSRPPGGRDQ